MNADALLRRTLLLSLLSICAVCDDNCPIFSPECSRCQPEAVHGYELWCPSRQDSRFAVVYLSDQLKLEYHETQSDVGRFVETFGKIAVKSRVRELRVDYAPFLTAQAGYNDMFAANNMTEVEELSLNHNLCGRDGQLKGGIFDGLESIEKLSLQEHYDYPIKTINKTAFNGLINLKELHLVLNQVETLDEEVFAPLKKLEILRLIAPGLKSLPSQLFKAQTALTNLKLGTKSASRIPEGIFNPLNKVKSLELISSKMEFLPEDLLANMTLLRNFTFKGTGFEAAAKAGFFRNNTDLRRFEYFFTCRYGMNCGIDFRVEFLDGAENLKYFSVAKHPKLKVKFSNEGEFFKGCLNLDEIQLEKVGLENLPDKLFKGLRRLTTLNLSGNKISAINDQTFGELSALTTLLMPDNELTALTDNAFKSQRLLKTLDLSGNRIQSVGRFSFFPLKSLESLNLEGNKLSSEDSDDLEWASLTSLTTLKLARNNISIETFPDAWLFTSVRLETLDLSHNSVGPNLDALNMRFVQNDIRVDLSHNNVRSINFGDLMLATMDNEEDEEDDGDMTNPRPNIVLNSNPVRCDCHAIYLAKVIKGDLLKNWFKFDVDNLQCESPEAIKGQLVKSLHYDSFGCPSDKDCPRKCKCLAKPYTKSIEVQCQSKGLSKFPSPLPNGDSITVDLHDNGLSSMTNDPAITSLILSQNEFVTLEDSEFPPNLRRFDIRDNRIESLSEETAQFLSGLDTLWLGNNAFACDCDSSVLFRFVQQYKHIIEDLENVTVTCSGESRPILDWTIGELCPNILLGVVLPIIFVAIIAALIVAVFCLYNKNAILIVIYNNRSLRKFFCFPDEPEMAFDAFVSYSNEDAHFVEKILIPELEEGNSSDLSYKCLTHLQFEPGRNIMEQIDESISKSSRVLVVLSKNFVTSPWYEREFEAAVNRNQSGVIVVVLGETPSEDEMGPRMFDYVKTYTYLKSEDPKFFDKLRYRLPRKRPPKVKVKKSKSKVGNGDLELRENKYAARNGGFSASTANSISIFVEESPPNTANGFRLPA